jgi:hypothetical protein
MSPPTQNGGPGITSSEPAAASINLDPATITKQDHGQDNDGRRRRRDRLVAFGEYHPPVGRRRLGAVIVRRCPACAHLHQHRAVLPRTVDGETRVGSCGAEYALRVLPAPRIEGAA